jgi:peptidoglycan/xylan/chitin deacetylase (PgdA/CDA1 family)
MYHRIGDGAVAGREPLEETYAVPAAAFAGHLEVIASGAASPVAFEAVAGAALEGRALPDRAVALTFDDGNASDYTEAFPALLRLGLKAAFFLSPALVGSPGYLTWAEAREMAAAGMTLGAHGFDHRLLSSLDDAELRRDLREARRLMEARLGRPPLFLSLPGGEGGGRAVAAALEEGFLLVAGSSPRRVRPGRRRVRLPRFPVRRRDSLERFRSVIEQRPLLLAREWVRHHGLMWLRRRVGEDAFQALRRLVVREGAPV